tara:strand:+ start:195 stop:743 length:549 start_codon:yes stop_codon:yes gene_type:complete
MQKLTKILTNLLGVFLLCLILSSCVPGGLKPGDARKMEMEGEKRARQNIEEGKGWSLSTANMRKKTTFEFSTSNPMWRATFDVIDFMPFVTVDYAGGMIITDWYTDSNTSNDSLKFTIRFLSNEIRADSLKIIIHKKTCKTQTNCIIKKIASAKLEDTIRSDIIKKAAILDAATKNKKNKKR